MSFLADTHLLLRAIFEPWELEKSVQRRLEDQDESVFFSTVSIWETAIKFARGKPDFAFPPEQFRASLLSSGFSELSITSEHVLATLTLPALHRDPFDRLLVAQANVEGMVLLTADKLLSKYPGARRV